MRKTVASIACAIALWAFLPHLAHAQESRRAFERITDSLVNSSISTGKTSGAVLWVGSGCEVILHRAYGHASHFDSALKRLAAPEAMTERHLFDIASLTKVVGTTTGIMVLVDRGKLTVDDPVSAHIPSYATKEKGAITIRHLLAHRSGMIDWYPMYYRASERSQAHALISQLPLQSPVGTRRKYSDLGFTLLGQIIEKVSGMALDTFLMKEVFLPLGMRNTLYNPLRSNRNLPIAATSHGNPYEYRMVHDPLLGYVFPEIEPGSWKGWRSRTLKGEVNDGNAWHAGKGVSGAAGLFSTAEDLSVIVRMLLSGGMHGGKQFLKEATVRSFLTPNEDGHGLGWMMDPSSSFMKGAPKGSFGHTGFTGTSIAVDPSSGLYVILLTNRQHGGLLPSREYPNVGALRQALFVEAMKSLKR